MNKQARPVFYKPDFGNDNAFVKFDAVDVAAFRSPFMAQSDAALNQTDPALEKAANANA